MLLGVDSALLWAVLTFFLSFIPYIGLTVAMIGPTLLALAEFGPTRALVVIVGAVVINLAIENPPTRDGKVSIQNQMTETHTVLSLAKLVSQMTGPHCQGNSCIQRHWNPAKEAQATDRVYRIGQTRGVIVI